MAETVGPRMKRTFIQAMAKHLPPSAANLRLLDIGGHTGEVLAEARGDLDIALVDWAQINSQPAESADAIVGYGADLNDDALQGALQVLRPGGRLILLSPEGDVDENLGHTLENAGYTRILVEPGMDCPVVAGVLMRGEKPHVEEHTADRIRQVAERDEDALDFSDYKGRYVHLLIKQTPNKPAWSLQEGEKVEWEAATLGTGNQPAVLAFSSLPKAVAFMQPAVMNGKIDGVNKIGKFRREVAQAWTFPVLLNPVLDVLAEYPVNFVPVDAQVAEVPDE